MNIFSGDKPQPEGDPPWISFDIEMIMALRKEVQSAIDFVLMELPGNVKWTSSDQVRRFFYNEYDIRLPDVKIRTLLPILESLPHDSEAFDALNGFVIFTKHRYTIKNYLDCVLRHNEGGKVTLRWTNNGWRLPNRQPVPDAPQILECIVAREGV